MATRMSETFYHALMRGAPLLAVKANDQIAAIGELVAEARSHPNMASLVTLVQWDAGSAAGFTGLNDKGRAWVDAKPWENAAVIRDLRLPKGINPLAMGDAVFAALTLPPKSAVLFRGANREFDKPDAGPLIATVANLRNQFKGNFRVAVFMGPDFSPPIDIANDFIVLTHELANADERRARLTTVYREAKVPLPADVESLVGATASMTAFGAEQAYALSIRKEGMDRKALNDLRTASINEVPGLTVMKGAETFADVKGLKSVTDTLRRYKTARRPVRLVVMMEEISDAFSTVGAGASEQKMDQQRALLVAMEEYKWRGVMAVGVPGTAKSLLTRALGNELGVISVALDLGATEDKLVGESEKRLRRVIETLRALGEDGVLFIVNANTLTGLRPQFLSRFDAIFFFDYPTEEERLAMWAFFLARRGFPLDTALPDHRGWTGREIFKTVERAWDLNISILEAAESIVPVSRSRGEEIEAWRQAASGKYLDASHPGIYIPRKDAAAHVVTAGEAAKARERAIDLGDDPIGAAVVTHGSRHLTKN